MISFRLRIWLAKLALFFESCWLTIFPFLITTGILLLLIILSVPKLLGGYLFSILLLPYLVIIFFTAKSLFKLRWPGKSDAIRRIEKTSDLENQPLLTHFDSLTSDSSESNQLWQEHKKRTIHELKKLRLVYPKSLLRYKDPYALRFALLLLLISFGFLSGLNFGNKLSFNSLYRINSHGGVDIWLDAWVTPPEYTGAAPIFLTNRNLDHTANIANKVNKHSKTDVSIEEHSKKIAVPAGSKLVLRSKGNIDDLSMVSLWTEVEKNKNIMLKADSEAVVDGISEVNYILNKPIIVRLLNDKKLILDVIEDQKPISSIEEVKSTVGGALKIKLLVKDDYGVAKVFIEFVLSDDQGEGDIGIDSSSIFLIDPPDFEVLVNSSNPREIKQSVLRKLVSHPWAGMLVDITAVAVDNNYQRAVSNVSRVKLPTKVFTKPLAKALIEQRSILLNNYDEQIQVARAIEALTIYPNGLIEDSSTYLNIRTAYLQLIRTQSDDDFINIADILWKIAIDIEDGGIERSKDALLEAHRKLMEAVAGKASEKELSELTDNLRNKLGAFMNEISKNIITGDAADNIKSNGEAISMLDLQKTLDRIDSLLKVGNKEAAKKLLVELQNTLENINITPMTPEMIEKIKKLSELFARIDKLAASQNSLMDKAFKYWQQLDNGQRRKNSKICKLSREMRELKKSQDSLMKKLAEILGQVLKEKLINPSDLATAADSMANSSLDLKKCQVSSSLDHQNSAYESLRKLLQNIAKNMPSMSLISKAKGTDPLGRNVGKDINIPDKGDIQHIHKLMRDLNEKLENYSIPNTEREYIERLLDQFGE